MEYDTHTNKIAVLNGSTSLFHICILNQTQINDISALCCRLTCSSNNCQIKVNYICDWSLCYVYTYTILRIKSVCNDQKRKSYGEQQNEKKEEEKESIQILIDFAILQ